MTGKNEECNKHVLRQAAAGMWARVLVVVECVVETPM